MIPKDCKRLAEVDFPIAEVSRHAAREKSIRHGHPSTLHLWWARRPLASSRAVLLALLWPDPCDPLCPAEFKAEAKKRLRQVAGCNPGTTDEDLRKALLRFIADFANWDNAANRTYLEVSRALVKVAHAPADGGEGYEPPLVVDPFAGGGSIPLEALRLGCEAFASDLNPVACLILKVLLEHIPRHGPKLAEELRRAGAAIKTQAQTELAELYPRDPGGATPIAYLWARTVRCESPNCGAEIPLVRSLWLSKKASRRRALRYKVEQPRRGTPYLTLEIFEPERDEGVSAGTVTLAKAKCLCCGTVLSRARVRAQLCAQNGGSDVLFDKHWNRMGGAMLLAVAILKAGEMGRQYRLPTDADYRAVAIATQRAAKLSETVLSSGISVLPRELLAIRNARNSGFGPRLYGAVRWDQLYNARQKCAMDALARAIRESHHERAESRGVADLLALGVSKLAELASAYCAWEPIAECPRHVFGRQAIPVNWDFAEGVPISESSGSYSVVISNLAGTLQSIGSNWGACHPQVADACESPLPSESADVWFTDPPYYDSVAYADLSDFFFVWLKRVLPESRLFRDPFDIRNPLTPKDRECIQNEECRIDGRAKDASFFEAGLTRAFAEGRRVLRSRGVACVVFAHKSTEGWEALLTGMLSSGWVVTASWPVTTEMGSRLVARNTASLSASVHLVCRPRPDDAPIGDWADVLRELPPHVGDWMERLQGEGVRGADLVFACIGPALEIFSRYAKVETADGREVKLAEYLEKVWEVVGREALAQVLGTAEARARNGAAGAVEEDARLTALFLWTLESTDDDADEGGAEGDDEEAVEDEEDNEEPSRGRAKAFTLVFDVVRRFAQPLGIDLSKWEGRVIETKKGVVRLLPIAERAKQLFGAEGAQAVATRLEQEAALGPQSLQGMLFPEMEATPKVRGRGARGRGRRAGAGVSDENLAAAREATTLDRVHAAMLLQAGGRTNALRALVKAEQERGPDFLRLANALSALYPKRSEEKRLVDAMLLAVPR